MVLGRFFGGGLLGQFQDKLLPHHNSQVSMLFYLGGAVYRFLHFFILTVTHITYLTNFSGNHMLVTSNLLVCNFN